MSDAARLRFFERLADNELFLLLTEEARDENISPGSCLTWLMVRFVLAFDREEQTGASLRAVLPLMPLCPDVFWRRCCAGQGIGLGLNLEVAPSSMLIPAEAYGLACGSDPGAMPRKKCNRRLTEFLPPAGLPDILLTALDTKLATAGRSGLKPHISPEPAPTGGGQGHLLGFRGRGRPVPKTRLGQGGRPKL